MRFAYAPPAAAGGGRSIYRERTAGGVPFGRGFVSLMAWFGDGWTTIGTHTRLSASPASWPGLATCDVFSGPEGFTLASLGSPCGSLHWRPGRPDTSLLSGADTSPVCVLTPLAWASWGRSRS